MIVLLLACTISSICLTVASLSVLTPNAVSFVFYLQPLVVAAYLTCAATQFSTTRQWLCPWGLFFALALLVSIRAVGLSTWGIACTRDFSYSQAKSRVQMQLAACRTNATVVLSSASCPSRSLRACEAHSLGLDDTGRARFSQHRLGRAVKIETGNDHADTF